MADSKWNEWKEEHIESKTKSCLPRRNTSEVERTFHDSAPKPSWNHWHIYPKNYERPIRHQTRTVYGERTWHSIEKITSRKAAGIEDKEIWWHTFPTMQCCL